MSFNVFGPTTGKDVRVGYISTDRGYVTGLTVLEANQYAFRNPGTQFILTTRDKTRYLNINEVNNLTKEDLLPKNNAAQGTCDGITGLDPSNVKPTPPTVVISGGGGVGAVGNPVIGEDGSLLDIIVTNGGYGYAIPPQVNFVDPERFGTGVVASATVGLTTTTILEEYTAEDEFEIYDFTPDGSGLSGYGSVVDVNGNATGDWDPTLYASFEQDPIGIEIARYQQFLSELDNPWWHTRKETPLSVTFLDKTTRVVHEVKHPEWARALTKKKTDTSNTSNTTSTVSTELTEVQFEVYTQGGNQRDRGLAFKFTSEDGSHKFQFTASNFKDAKKTKVTKRVKKNTKYKVVAIGSYKGKGVEQGLVGGFGRRPKEVNKEKTGSVIFADFVKSSNDNDDLQIRAPQGIFTANRLPEKPEGHSTFALTYELKDDSVSKARKTKPSTKIVKTEVDSFMNKYAVCPTPMSNIPGSDYAGRICTFEWEEDFPITGDYIFRGMADNISKVYIDNDIIMQPKHFRGHPLPKDIVKKTIESGPHRIKIDLYNIPILEPKPQASGPQDLTITYHGLNRGSSIKVSEERVYPIKVADRGRLGRGNNAAVKSVSNKTIKFTDSTSQNDTDAEFKIVSPSPGVSAKFRGSNDNNLELVVRGKGDVTLRLEWNDDPRSNGEAVGNIKVAGETWKQTAFKNKKGDVEKTINVGFKETKEVVGKGGYIVSGDKKEVRMKDGHGDDINSTFSIEDSTNNARFSNDGKRLITDGPGNVVLRLKWNDNPKTAGVAVDKIEVGGVVLDQRREKGRVTKTLVVKGSPSSSKSSSNSQSTGMIFNTIDYIKKADRKLWRTNVFNRGGFLNDYGVCPFDTRKVLDDNPYGGTHVIRWEHVTFPADGNYKITVDCDDRVKLFIGNRTGSGAIGIGNGLKDIEQGGDEVIIENGMDKKTYTKFFKKGQYRIRAELYQKPGGRFGFGTDGRAELSPRFSKQGNDLFLIVDGNGTGTINFKLRTDDNPRTKGNALTSLQIGDVTLKRTRIGVGGRGGSKGRFKEKEVITGSGTFTGGQKYKIVVRGSSPTSGSVIRGGGDRIVFDDDIGNGVDMNAELTLGRIKDVKSSPVKGLNPMALAMTIEGQAAEEKKISARSWNQNPFGAALTIEAPLPAIPESPRVLAEGRCPENPTWTTRFSGGQEKWWPVTHRRADGSKSWSKFMNRYAISPIPPLAQKGTDGAGIVYTNSWNIDIPYSGFHAMKGTVDNGGRILVDGQVILQGGYFSGAKFAGSARTLEGFGSVSPKFKKFYLEKGKHTITVDVENRDHSTKKIIEKKIFTTKDWIKPVKEGSPVPTELTVEYRGLNQGITKTVSGEKEYPIIYEDLNSTNLPNTGRGARGGIRVVKNGKRIELKDGRGNDANVEFEILSPSPGVSAKFSDDGRKLLIKGNGDVPIRIKYDDNPGYAGEAVRSITIAGTKWRKKRTEYGEETKTIKVGSKDTTEVVGKGGYIVNGKRDEVRMKDGHGNDINSTFKIESSTVDAKFSSDGKRIEYKGSGTITLKLFWNDDPNKYGVAVDSIAVGGKVWNQKREKGSKTQTINVTSQSPAEAAIKGGQKIGGVTYEGPSLFNFKHRLWSNFMNNNSVSPFLGIPLDEDNDTITGTRTYIWKNVNFPETGRYKIYFQSDDQADLFIDGNLTKKSRGFRGDPEETYAEITTGNYEVKVVCNNLNFAGRNRFRNNPTGFAVRILKDITVRGEGQSWKNNPVGISAILVPPPCPKVITGKGRVEDIIVKQPGNGFIVPPGEGFPTIVTVKDVDITSPGINYSPDDVALIDGIPVPIVVDNFGRIQSIDPGAGGPISVTRYPSLTVPSRTGAGFRGNPIMETSIVPEDVFDEDQILQVTDLVGLKQTGYVNGKPYYGSVFSKDGQLFAGIYETIGELIPVYATLQESIDARITTRPSAILRQGTDVTNNDPRLNIPGTPQNLI